MTKQTADIGRMFGAAEAVETFMGFPACPDIGAAQAEIAILGAPCASPYRSVGPYCAGAPAAIRAGIAGYATSRSHQDFDLGGPLLGDTDARVVDCGDLPYDPEDSPGNRARIGRAVATLLERAVRPVVIGGDDSIPIPVLQAYEGHAPLTVVQIDAHIDWRDEVQGERFGLSSTMRRTSEMPWVERIIQVGARAIGSARPGDYQDALDWGVNFVTARDLDAHGLEPVLDLVPRGAEVFFTLDCDGLDPSIMPAVIGPAPGGLRYWQAVTLLHGLAAKARIAGFDIVEFMPARDVQGLAALTAARLVCNVIGLMARQG
ncbi:MAG TPA: agmatinase [Kiloniellales bacterium]